MYDHQLTTRRKSNVGLSHWKLGLHFVYSQPSITSVRRMRLVSLESRDRARSAHWIQATWRTRLLQYLLPFADITTISWPKTVVARSVEPTCSTAIINYSGINFTCGQVNYDECCDGRLPALFCRGLRLRRRSGGSQLPRTRPYGLSRAGRGGVPFVRGSDGPLRLARSAVGLPARRCRVALLRSHLGGRRPARLPGDHRELLGRRRRLLRGVLDVLRRRTGACADDWCHAVVP